ncbi:MAG: FtsL-like putative cell division protein [Bacteroidota bacterium]
MAAGTVQKKKKGTLSGLGQTGTFVMVKNLPFFVFLAFLAAIYIANAHYAEKKVREIQALQNELKLKRWEYMTLKSELMYRSKQAEIAEKVKTIGLKEARTKPYRIIND